MAHMLLPYMALPNCSFKAAFQVFCVTSSFSAIAATKIKTFMTSKFYPSFKERFVFAQFSYESLFSPNTKSWKSCGSGNPETGASMVYQFMSALF